MSSTTPLAGWLLSAAFAVLAVVPSACVFQSGSLPQTERFAELRAGVSTKEDVRSTLGDPQGNGAARFTSALEIREIWLYHYAIHADVATLLVFFNENRYDGYLWISTQEAAKLDVAERRGEAD